MVFNGEWLKRLRPLCLGLVALSLLAAVGPALASELEQKQQELQQIQRQMEEQQQRVSRARSQVGSVADQLRLIQMDLDAATDEYRSIQAELARTEEQIKTNAALLAKLEKSLAERQQVLNKRMRDIYENGQVSYVDVVLGASDFNDFVNRVEILRRILRQDITLIAKIREERALAEEKQAELERDRAAVLQLKEAAAKKKALIEARRNERQAVLDAAVNERDIAERAYQELLETSREIERIIRSIQSGNGAPGGTGKMIWPISGPITSPFGWRTHPIFGTRILHTGIDIGADYGDRVVAADSGIVIAAGWMGGYGKAVIIDHGNGIATLYGHNSELLVAEGQRVVKGQTIARAGATGYATGPHVHFEVRVNGTPVNPLPYLP